MQKSQWDTSYLEVFSNHLFVDMHSNCIGLIKTVDTNSRLNFGQHLENQVDVKRPVEWVTCLSLSTYIPLFHTVVSSLFFYPYLSFSRRQTGAKKKTKTAADK